MRDDQQKAILSQFGRRVRAARILRDMTLQDCATAAGMSYSNLSLLERGKRSLYIENAPALAQALGVPLADLISEKDAVSHGA